MRARGLLIVALAAVALFVGWVGTCDAQIPTPVGFRAYLTVNGSQVSTGSYQVKVTDTSGTQFTDSNLNPAESNLTSGRFLFNIPMYEGTDQPGGAHAGATACIQIWQGATQLTISSPARGSCPALSGAFTMVNTGEAIGFGTTGTPNDASHTFGQNITATTPANITVNPSTTQTFDSTKTNASSTALTFTVANTGGDSITLGTRTISGTDPDQFAISSTNCTSTLAGGASCTVGVTFSPTTTGAKGPAILNIPSDAPNNTNLTVSLTGTGTEANISVPLTPMDYDAVNVNSPSSQTLTVTNSGTASLAITTATISGTHYLQFEKGTDGCSSSSVAAGDTCSIQVTFTPTSFGSKTATLTISSDDPDTPDRTVALTGVGMANNIAVSAPTLASGTLPFGTVTIGYTKDLAITVTNQGNAVLTVSSVTISDPNSGFSLVSPTIADGTIIAAGQSGTITARFSASSVGSASVDVTINSDGYNSTSNSVTLTATAAVAPTANITIAPSGTINFGNNDIDETSDNTTNTITVTSDGTFDLTIGTVSFNDTTNYTITSDACSGQTVPYSGSGTCQIVVRFNPTTVGSKAATITIPSNNGNIDATVDQTSTKNLTGVGIQYGLTVTPSSLNFGTVLLPDNTASGIGATCTDNTDGTVGCTVTIQNTGTEALTSFTLSTTNGSQFSVTPPTIASLAGNASTTATVTYQSVAAASAHTGTLTVSSGSFTRTVSLTGATNTRPATPTNSSPANVATDTSVTPTLTAGAFSDADSDTHASSTWQIASAAGFSASAIVFQSTNDTSNLTAITIPPGVLQQNTAYYWRVSYKDSRGVASTVSTGTSFTTLTVTMNTSGTTPDATTVKSGSGTEITTISSANLPSSIANVSSQLLADYSAVNCGTTADTSTDSVAIVKAKGGIDKDVLGIVTPAGTKIETVSTTTTSDTAFTTTPPSTFTFPYGVVSFRITDVTVGATVNVTIYTPTALPSDAVWYKYSAANGWLKINSTGTYNAAGTLLSSNTKFNVVSGKGVLTLKDDDVADVSTEVIGGKAVIVDPGAPGVPVPEPAAAAAAADSSGGGGGGCFIATAAFGSYFDPYVTILRNFRDGFLLTNRTGQAFVEWYYRVSPPVADYISGSETLKAGVRMMLLPAVGFSALSLKVGPVMTLFLFLAIMCGTAIALRKCWKYVLNK